VSGGGRKAEEANRRSEMGEKIRSFRELKVYPKAFCLQQGIFEISKGDAFVKSPKTPFSVIPAKAGIQCLQAFLDSRLRGSDGYRDFLRTHQRFSKRRDILPYRPDTPLLQIDWK